MEDLFEIPTFLRRTEGKQSNLDRPLHRMARPKAAKPAKAGKAKVSDGQIAILREWGYTWAEIKPMRVSHVTRIIENNTPPHVWRAGKL